MNRRSLLTGLMATPLAALVPSYVESAVVPDGEPAMFAVSDLGVMTSVDFGSGGDKTYVWVARRVGETTWQIRRIEARPLGDGTAEPVLAD